MKPRGFKGKYFSLAAILAVSTSVTLSAQSVAMTNYDVATASEKEEKSDEADALLEPVVSKESDSSGSLALEPLVVSATKTPQPISHITSNLHIITSEELQAHHYTTVIEALQSIPGISIGTAGGLGKQASIYLRGAGNERTLILINGTKYVDPTNFSGTEFQHLTVGEIERIEVIKGPQSGIWGAEAAAGVINIITKEAAAGTHAGVLVEAGSYNTKKASAYAGYKNETFDLKLSVLKLTSDGFSAKVPEDKHEEDYEKDGYVNTTYTFNGGTKLIGDDRLQLDYTEIVTETDFDSTGPDDATARTTLAARTTALSYEKTVNAHTIRLSQGSTQTDRNYYGSDFVGTVTTNELRDTFRYGNDHFLIAGVGGEIQKATFDSGEDEHKSSAVFITNSNTLGSLTLTEALRSESYDTFDDTTTGKIGVKYRITDESYIAANYGTAYTTPSISEMLNPWGVANMNLKPETFKGYDVTLGSGGFSMTYFDNVVENLIEWYDPDSMAWGDEYNVNTSGKSTFKGYEIAYTNHFESLDLALMLAYTNTQAKDNDGAQLAKRPVEQSDFSVDYYPNDTLHIGLNGSHIGERFENVYGVGKKETGNYTLLNAVANYDLDDTSRLYLKIENLGNIDYQTAYGYATADRSYYLGISAAF